MWSFFEWSFLKIYVKLRSVEGQERLGPQLGHRFESLKEQYESKGIRIDRIDPERFGAMDAKAVLEQAFPDLSGQIGDK